MGWEELMAARAKAQRIAIEAAERVKQAAEEEERAAAASAMNEAAIAGVVKLLGDEPESLPDGYACACVGAPPGCTYCYCHINEEARARIEGRACRWASCNPAPSEEPDWENYVDEFGWG